MAKNQSKKKVGKVNFLDTPGAKDEDTKPNRQSIPPHINLRSLSSSMTPVDLQEAQSKFPPIPALARSHTITSEKTFNTKFASVS